MNLLSLFGQSSREFDPYMYETMYNYNSQGGYQQLSNEAAAGAAIGAVLFFLFVGLVVYALFAFLLSRIFKKAGVEQWKAWIPFYNMWTFLELGGQKGYWAVLMIIPILNLAAIAFTVMAAHNIGLKLGKEGWFVFMAIWLPWVWLIWLGFDESTWKGGGTKSTSAPTPAKA